MITSIQLNFIYLHNICYNHDCLQGTEEQRKGNMTHIYHKLAIVFVIVTLKVQI